MLKIALNKLPQLFAELEKAGELYVPCKNKTGKVDFSKWEAEKECFFDVLLTSKSAKDFFLPQVEDLLAFQTDGKKLAIEQMLPSDTTTILMGVRACDVRSFGLLDKVFLQAPVDTYYAARRKNTVIIGMGCSAPEETCFCHSFGIDATAPASDVQTWIAGENLYWNAVSEAGKALTAKVNALFEEADETEVTAQQAKTKEILSKLPLANI